MRIATLCAFHRLPRFSNFLSQLYLTLSLSISNSMHCSTEIYSNLISADVKGNGKERNSIYFYTHDREKKVNYSFHALPHRRRWLQFSFLSFFSMGRKWHFQQCRSTGAKLRLKICLVLLYDDTQSIRRDSKRVCLGGAWRLVQFMATYTL